MARSLADIFTGAAGLDAPTTIIMGVISCIAMVGIVWYTTYISRKAVNNALRQHAEELPPELTGDEEVVTLLGGPDPIEHPHGEIELGEARMDTAVEVTEILGSGAPGLLSAQQTAMQQSGTPRSRQRSTMQLGGTTSGSASADEESQVLLPKGPRRNELQKQGSGLHARSGHASPRSPSPKAAGRWNQGTFA